MLVPNETCTNGVIGLEAFSDVLYASSFISTAIYCMGVFALIYRRPENFRKYQTLLCVHTLINVICENYLTTIWKVVIIPPWLSLCSFGIISNYPVVGLWGFSTLLAGAGISITKLFDYRMKAAISIIPVRMAKVAQVMKYLFYSSEVVLFISYPIAFDSFTYQADYKADLHRNTGPLPNFMFCDNCILFNFHTPECLLVVIASCLSITFAIHTNVLMAWITYHVLHSRNNMFSTRTMTVQKSFLNSLLIQILVHLIFLAFPLSLFFAAFLMNLSMEKWQMSANGLVIIIAQHGTFSTLAMVVSNKQLKQNLYSFFRRSLRQVRGYTPDHDSSNNNSKFHYRVSRNV